MDATRAFYEVAHRVGFHPWEDAADHAPFAERIAERLDYEARGDGPLGKALDLGCGSGIWTVELARRGWRVTGVDTSAPALRRARKRIDRADAQARLARGDVTALAPSGVGSGFELMLDTGTFHGLDPAKRGAMGAELTRVSAPDATVLLLVWAPRRRGPLPRGASRADVEAAFPQWKLTHVVPADPAPPQLIARLGADEHWYRLRRGRERPLA